MSQGAKNTIDITMGIGGSIETAIVPYHIARLRGTHPNIRVFCVLSPGALQFVTETSMKGISGCEVFKEETRFCADGQPAHLVNAGRDLTVIYPATARIIAEMALGIVTCPITRLFAFCDKRKVIITPYLHPSMEISLYSSHIHTLKSIGCRVVEPSDELFWDNESAWVATGMAIRGFLGLDETVETATSIRLSTPY